MNLGRCLSPCSRWINHGMVKVWLTLALCVPLAGMPTWVHAQVWGYVDDRGVAHFAAERVDERYELFYRGDAMVALHTADTASAIHRSADGLFSGHGADHSGWETPYLVGSAFPETGAVVAPIPLTAFFEVSPAYKAVRHLIREAAQAHGVDAHLLQAMIATESGFDARAISPRGAVGLMQIMPATAREHGLNARSPRNVEKLLTDPRTNIQTGARIVARLQARFPDQPEVALAAYNAGEGAVRRAGRQVPPIAETRKYVRTVMQIYQYLQPPKALQARTREVSATLADASPAQLSSAHSLSNAPTVQPLNGGASGRHNMVAP